MNSKNKMKCLKISKHRPTWQNNNTYQETIYNGLKIVFRLRDKVQNKVCEYVINLKDPESRTKHQLIQKVAQFE